jgi:hypothetical protein
MHHPPQLHLYPLLSLHLVSELGELGVAGVGDGSGSLGLELEGGGLYESVSISMTSQTG